LIGRKKHKQLVNLNVNMHPYIITVCTLSMLYLVVVVTAAAVIALVVSSTLAFLFRFNDWRA